MSVTDRSGRRVYAVASDEMIAQLQARGFAVVLAASPARDGYRTPAQINDALRAMAGPGAVLEQLGTSVNGVPILGLRIGTGPRHIRVLGGHHGDELPAVEFPTDWAAALLQRLTTDSAFATQLAGLTVLVAPLVNPDGVTLAQRYNANNIDLNRNYSYEWVGEDQLGGPAAFSEPETRAVALDNEYHRYAASLTYHTGATNIGYPWNYTTAPFTAEPLLAAAAQQYTALIGSPFYSIRGADWYLSNGDTNDYSWGYYGGFDLTVELTGPTKSPDISELAGIEAPHIAAAYDWLTHAQETALVHVTDSTDGSALAAQVSGAGVSTWSNVLDGVAQLQAASGTVLTVSKPGYADASVTVGADQAEVVLVPNGAWVALPVPSDFGENGALSFTLPAATAVHAYKPGAVDIDFTCANDTCTAPAANRRPGLYDCAVTGPGGVHPQRNCLLLHEVATTSAATQAQATVMFIATWKGATAVVPAGTAAPSDGVLAWVSNGELYTENTQAPVPPPIVASQKRKGCASTPDALALAPLLLVLWRRRHAAR